MESAIEQVFDRHDECPGYLATAIANRDAILVDRAENVRVNDNNVPSWQVRLHDGVIAYNN
ncbi:hypothetical protein [Leptolyngbya sp. NIES-2104]|uniref:hypothetical protein n=1 Tax=Leptolyngbya sp. NIES-2104 TaxID=1552121 RepID=UPI0006EC6733|nr:hypothetical protein [Leptolyngbya sp. NIES-2104]GAP96995.1 hypothetical protein NIES2104_35420 [Leptolyngbya sp. NIES-2104]